MRVSVTYFVEIISSWCHWAEPAWAELKAHYAGQSVAFDWKIALLDAEALPKSRGQCDWFYRRSGTIVRSPYMLSSAWFESGRTEYLAPNCVAEAAKDFGIRDDRARLAVARAALIEGQRVGDWAVAAGAVAQSVGLDASALMAHAQSQAVEKRCRVSTAQFHEFRATQRPAFLIENAIGDRAVLSGLFVAAPIRAVIDAMLADAAGYECCAAHFGGPPAS
jgi:predicted DsbA family dithiol-disulfide isomerase